MPDFLVTVKYNPGTPKMYIVQNVATHREARDHVINNVILYNPGVEIDVVQTPITKNKAVTFYA